MILSILYISNQKSLIKNQQSFYHLILSLMTLPSRDIITKRDFRFQQG
ncbi:hypothetical protein SAMN05444143_101272 [Flavobacterium succinicans]|jgi:hypothetical protein|uniref:Uncharacterized protein n=1 Tax=Flavobacterium succinicans TaxID=29536 RepID=A0A1I4RAD8_9FLAO|nr:hypothetical protein SAMN05444143_101272 [Flavobacterium succinicans]